MFSTFDCSIDKGIYFQSVIENSTAYKKGVRPSMKIAKIDSLDFDNGNDFCDYVCHEPGDKIFLQSIDSTGQKLEYYFEKTILHNTNANSHMGKRGDSGCIQHLVSVLAFSPVNKTALRKPRQSILTNRCASYGESLKFTNINKN